MTDSGPRFGAQALSWLAAFTILAATIVLAVLFWQRTGWTPPPRDLTTAWQTRPPVVEATPGGLLEVATVRMTEDFYRSDSRTWWGIYLGSTVSQIQASAVYRYGVPLSDPAWQIAARGQTAVVVAPDLRPSLPVAIDTATLREKTENGWARFDKQEQLDALRRSLSTELETRANDPARMVLARDTARRTIGEFVDRWLLAQDEWTADVFNTVKVFFADEVDDALRRQLRGR
ncbi:MAG: hypothetical protein R2752_13330 [Vicinamibacterales bacterium]